MVRFRGMSNPVTDTRWLREPAVNEALDVLRARATELGVEVVVSRAGVDVRAMPKIVTPIGEKAQRGRRGLFAKPLGT